MLAGNAAFTTEATTVSQVTVGRGGAIVVVNTPVASIVPVQSGAPVASKPTSLRKPAAESQNKLGVKHDFNEFGIVCVRGPMFPLQSIVCIVSAPLVSVDT